MLDNSSKSLDSTMMAAARINDDLRGWIGSIAGPRGWDDTRESWLARAARRLGLPYRRVRALYYGEARRVDAAEYLMIRARAQVARDAALEGAIDAQTSALAALAADRCLAVAGGTIAVDIEMGAGACPPADAVIAPRSGS